MVLPTAMLGAALLLAACAPTTVVLRANDFDPRSEKTLYAALRETGASDEQRLAILAAYDRHQPQLKQLSAESARLVEAWRMLDRRAPDFDASAAGIAAQWSTLAAKQVAAQSAFEREVAGQFDAEQWEIWQARWAAAEFDPRLGPRPGPGGITQRR